MLTDICRIALFFFESLPGPSGETMGRERGGLPWVARLRGGKFGGGTSSKRKRFWGGN